MIVCCRAPRVERPDLLALYRREPTRRLELLRRAFQTNRREVPEKQAWCDHRLRLIAQVLAERDAPLNDS